MFEKVNPAHPDKVADRIAGAIVDLAYASETNPKIAVEVLIGHGICHIIAETSTLISKADLEKTVRRLAGNVAVDIKLVPQDIHLVKNQCWKLRCGDNGIFLGLPITEEENKLSEIAKSIYAAYPTDGKYILDGEKLVICQSHVETKKLQAAYPNAIVNPLGDWTGSTDVDTGATNRKLGSDMGSSVTGGGLHGKDLSKADVTLNIYAHLLAQKSGKPIHLSCAIGDAFVDGKPYAELVEIARDYIRAVGGFEKFAEWGLI